MRHAWLLFLIAAACGGQTVSGNDAAVGDAGTPDTLMTLSDVCDGVPSLTGNHLLSLLHPVYMGTFTPAAGGAPSALQLFVTYENGAITCHPHVVSNGGPPDMAASISLAVTLQLFTADGTFQEKFSAEVTLADGVSESALPFAGSVPVASLQGKYQPVIGGTWDSHDVEFSGTLVYPPSFDAGADNGSTTGSAVEQASNANMGKVQGAGSWQ